MRVASGHKIRSKIASLAARAARRLALKRPFDV
jgi:hypothetical protein